MTTQRKIKRFGWIKDHLDHRDFKLAVPSVDSPILKPSVDLRTSGFLPPVYDQGQLGSCTANAIGAAVDFRRKKQGEIFITPSRLFIYYNERAIEGTIGQDDGAEIRDGIKSVASLGVCPEVEWTYDDGPTKFAQRPSVKCFADALTHKALKYLSVNQSAYSIKSCLDTMGCPVVYGMSVFESFESDAVASSGIITMPGHNDAPIGGHAVLIVGYDDKSQMFTVRNSWGTNWGQAGYFKIPYAYLLNPNLASDFWVITLEQ